MLQKTVKLGMRAMPGKDGIVKSEGLVPGHRGGVGGARSDEHVV